VCANVLIVEDEWLIAEDHAAILRAASHQVVGPCVSVAAAIKAIGENSVDLALLDIELRNEKSYPLAERLQDMNIPFAFVTGYGARDVPPAMHDHEVLPKPIGKAALLAAVDRMSAPGESSRGAVSAR
jgi:two-component SAPR family response regulator